MKTGPKPLGHEVPCVICGKMIYRGLVYLARTKRITCASKECITKAFSGANNPFWGKVHDERTKERISVHHKAFPPGKKKTGPPKGYKHTPEALAKMKAAMLRRWTDTRDLMLAQRAHLKLQKPREELRYRRSFNSNQRLAWREDKCCWCGSVENLQLDHIIPVMCGGVNEQRNAQTLCKPCNLWKMVNIDRQLFKAGLGEKADLNEPSRNMN